MKRIFLLFITVGFLFASVFAQIPQAAGGEDMTPTYRDADEVRNLLSLDSKQFSKVYDAYKKYNDAVFGSDQGLKPQQPRGNGRPGRPEGGQGRPGGPGFGNGRPPMDRPAGNMPSPPSSTSSKKKIDPAKREQQMQKQEEKLRKSMKKIFKDSAVYDRWLSIREKQLSSMSPSRAFDPDYEPKD